jgi:hypothetical protein
MVATLYLVEAFVSLTFCTYYIMVGVGCQGVFRFSLKNFFVALGMVLFFTALRFLLASPLAPLDTFFSVGSVGLCLISPWNNYSITDRHLFVKKYFYMFNM